ncbi:MAG: hypothetical protein U0586_01905 [Candidatus Brocadiaceae bacterium]
MKENQILDYEKVHVKILLKEVLPIAAFLGCFERPGLDLYCQYFSGDQSFDAKFIVKVYWLKESI